MQQPQSRNSTLWYFLILACAIVLIFLIFRSTPSTQPQEIPLSQVVTMSQADQIKEIDVNGQWLDITGQDGSALKSYIGNIGLYDIKDLNLTGVTVVIQPAGIDWGSIIIDLLFIGLALAFVYFLLIQARRANNQLMNFSRSNARLFPGNKPQVTFDDVAGVDEAKQELHEVVDFLKKRERFTALGARIPHGILLVGPPGTGKTLLAKAIAGEAGVPFYSISGSEFVEMFVGVGASRVRDLFNEAKHHAPCIIFIDEIDAVGRHRGAGLGGGNDEREQTLNQILTEMDGFDTNTNIIVLAATNRPDVLDPALLRPGRFDRRVVLDLPDVVGRSAILKVHTKNKPLGTSVNLDTLAKETAGFRGADLANLVNEAAILAARQGQKTIEMKELEESIDKVIAGPERRSKRISPKEKEITAYHEAGHALVAKMLPNADPPHKISIIARGMALGYTKQISEDRYLLSPSQLRDMITVFVSGHAAEKLMYNEASSGAQDDLKRATGVARRMVTDLGMSEKLGPRTFGDKQELIFLGREISEQKDYSEKTSEIIDNEMDEIIRSCYENSLKILTANKTKLTELAQALIVRETLDFDELEAIFKGETLPPKPLEVDSPQTKQPESTVQPKPDGILKPQPAAPPG
jgi:cell division protease FtsH